MARKLVMLALAGSLALAACGGGGSGSSKATYIKRADAICARVRAQTRPLIQQLAAAAVSPTAQSARQAAPAVTRLHEIGAGYIAELRALPQPSADRALLQTFLNDSSKVVDSLPPAASALAAADVTKALATLQRIAPASQEANSAATAYGFKQCQSVLALGG